MSVVPAPHESQAHGNPSHAAQQGQSGMICSLCGVDVERTERGGWKNGPKNVAYFAHHGLCPRESEKLWTEIKAERAAAGESECECGPAGCALDASLVDLGVPADDVPQSFEGAHVLDVMPEDE